MLPTSTTVDGTGSCSRTVPSFAVAFSTAATSVVRPSWVSVASATETFLVRTSGTPTLPLATRSVIWVVTGTTLPLAGSVLTTLPFCWVASSTICTVCTSNPDAFSDVVAASCVNPATAGTGD